MLLPEIATWPVVPAYAQCWMAAPGAAGEIGEIGDQTDKMPSAAEEELAECTSRFPVEFDGKGLPLCSAVLRRKK